MHKSNTIGLTFPEFGDNMKTVTFRLLCVAILSMVSAGVALAQSERVTSALGDKYVISAKAGGVNFVEGTVTSVDAAGINALVIKGDSVEVGERITTGADGRAEILLNPGSYVRLGPDTTFEFKTTSLDDLQVNLIKGNAVFEVFAGKEFTVKVLTPGPTFELIESGIFSIDAVGGRSSVAVWKGKAAVKGETDTEVKSGREAIVNGEQVAVNKFDKDERSPLEAWSKTRAKELAKMNDRLNPKDLRNTLMSSWRRGNWDMYSSFGLWVYDPFRGAFCFLPFGRGWSSPYGYGFGWDIWAYRLPWTIYYHYPQYPSGGGNNSPTTPTTPTTRGPIEDRRSSVPPFSRMENPSGRGGLGPIERKSTIDSGPIFDRPTSFPSAPPADSGSSTTKKPVN